jgi:hypothetical protein
MDWLFVLGLEEGLVECATLCIKSWVILMKLSLAKECLGFMVIETRKKT